MDIPFCVSSYYSFFGVLSCFVKNIILLWKCLAVSNEPYNTPVLMTTVKKVL
jgi:hypothetical protein